MHILVTGGAGFIGSNFIKKALDSGLSVTVLDNLSPVLYSAEIKAGRINRLSSKYKFDFIEQDINASSLGVGTKSFDCIVNFAALPGQILSWTHFKEYSDSNFLGVESLIRNFALKSNIPFIQISTSSVYGKIAVGTEDSKLEPYSPYGVTKRAAEQLLSAYHENFGLDYTIFRLFSVFGAGQRPDMGVHKFLRAIHDQKPVTVFGEGSQIRSMTPVNAVTTSILKHILTMRDQKTERIFNLSGKSCVSVLELIQMCESLIGKKAQLKFVPTPIGDQLNTFGDSSRAESILGFDASTDIASVLEEQYESILQFGV